MSDSRLVVVMHVAGMPTSAQRCLVIEISGAVLTTKFGRKLGSVLTLIVPNISSFDLTSCAILTHSHSVSHGRVTEAAATAYVKQTFIQFPCMY